MKFGGVKILRRFAPAYGPHYGVAAQGCMRGMGLIYVVSFWSLAAQIVGLSGSGGLVPAEWILTATRNAFEDWAPLYSPTLLWINSSSIFLLSLTGMGAFAGLCVLYGLYPWMAAAVCWICWVSLMQVCQPWLSGAGDFLTAETGLVLLFLLPPLSRYYPSPSKMGSRITGILLMNGLLFKVLFGSGLAKLTLGDPDWATSKAFFTFFETQAFPNIAAWYAHYFPGTILKYTLWGLMFVELILPFYVFLPRTFRNILAGGAGLEALFLLLTGNHGFLPLLLFVLAFSLVDDVSWRRILPVSWGPSAAISYYQLRWYTLLVLACILPLTIWQTYLKDNSVILPPWNEIEMGLSRVHSSNRYTLFNEVPDLRHEVSIQGSMDGRQWIEYRFRLKPTDPKSLPAFSLLHLPRLDEALVEFSKVLAKNPDANPPIWLTRLIHQLLRNDPVTLALFPANPFPQNPPVYIRIGLYEYRFADPITHRDQNVWWEREFKGFYGPVFSLPKNASGLQTTPLPKVVPE